jgi:hypothetical protein
LALHFEQIPVQTGWKTAEIRNYLRPDAHQLFKSRRARPADGVGDAIRNILDPFIPQECSKYLVSAGSART